MRKPFASPPPHILEIRRNLTISNNIHLKFIPGDQGAVFLSVMLLLLILTISGLSYLAMGGYEANLIKNRMDSSQAFYAAEAGIQQARWRISDVSNGPWDCVNCKPVVPWIGFPGSDGQGDYYEWEGALEDGMGDYTVKVRCNAGPNKVKIVSIGSLGLFERKVEVDKVPTTTTPPGSEPGRGGEWREPEF